MATSAHVWSESSSMHNTVHDVHTIERVVTEIFEVFLDIEDVDVSHNFFNLGGDSLKALMLTGEIAKAFDIQLPPTMLFDFPSIQVIVSEVVRITNARQ